jgi:hypothetical protein
MSTRRGFLRTLLAGVAAAVVRPFSGVTVTEVIYPITVAGKTFVPPDYEKLMLITRKAFVPRLFVQIWQEHIPELDDVPHSGLPPDARADDRG